MFKQLFSDKAECSAALFFSGYIVLILAPFCLEGRFVHNASYYALFLPSFIYFCVTSRSARLIEYIRHPLSALFFCFFAYMFLHTLLFASPVEKYKILTRIAITCTFLTASIVFFVSFAPETTKKLFVTLGIVGGVCALISIILHCYYNYSYILEVRLSPIGRGGDPILGPLLYVVPAACAFFYLREVSLVLRVLLTAAAVSVALMIFLAQTRTAMLMYVVCGGLCLLSRRNSEKEQRLPRVKPVYLVLGGLVLLAGLFAGWSMMAEVASKGIERSDNSRFIIWSLTWNEIKAAPIFGHGMDALLHWRIKYPHNIILAVWYYLGIMGLLLLLTALYRAVAYAIAHWGRDLMASLGLVLLASALVGGMTSDIQIAGSNEAYWVILWLPIALICASSFRKAHPHYTQYS